MRRIAITALIVLAMSAPAHVGAETLVTQKARTKSVLTGYSRAEHSMEVSAEVGGKVLRVNYDIGDRAGKEPFVAIDPTFVELELDATGRSLDKLEVALKRARSRAAHMKREFERLDGLFQGDRVTGQRRDAAEEEATQARLEVDSLLAEEAALKVRLEEAREKKARHFVGVPAGWTITGRAVEPGETVQPGVPLGRAADFRRLVVPLSVSSEELEGLLALGKSFTARLNGSDVKARVRHINPEFDEKTRKTAVELLITDYTGPMRGGLRFEMTVKVPGKGVLIPLGAVTERYGSAFVTLSGSGERVILLILDRTEAGVIAAPDPRLAPGTGLAPARGK